MNKKILLMFGLPILAIVLVSAAILSYFGIWTGTFTVTQAVTVENSPITFSENVIGEKVVIDCDTDDSGYWVKNNADVNTNVKFGTTCRNVAGFDDGIRNEVDIDWATFGGNACDGIETEIYGILKLTDKNVVFGISPWTAIGNKNATVKCTIVGDKFSAEVISSNGITLENYTLIYYKDNSDRFNQPAQAIKLNETTGSLPYAEDGNLNEYNYCGNSYQANISTGDNYEHCHGAKIWLVPTADISGGSLTWANAGDWLFETDLITYSATTSNVITLPANGGGFNFCVENDFASGLVGDTYTVESQILPA